MKLPLGQANYCPTKGPFSCYAGRLPYISGQARTMRGGCSRHTEEQHLHSIVDSLSGLYVLTSLGTAFVTCWAEGA